MADFWEQWFTNPAQNNMAPPFGAGEKKMGFDQITDTFRVVMAACKQLGDRITTGLGSMASQPANNVGITGGSIANTTLYASNAIDAEALKSGLIALDRLQTNLTGKYATGLTVPGMQALYNTLYPINTIRLWHTANLGVGDGLVWTNVTATWVIVPNSGDRYLVSAGSQTGVQQGGGTSAIIPPILGIATSPGPSNVVTQNNPVRYGFNIVKRTA